MKVERLRYMTEPFAEDLTVVGPISLTLYAAIDKAEAQYERGEGRPWEQVREELHAR